MSGEGIGYILAAPIVIGAVAVAGVGFAAYGIGKATWELGSWGVDYARKRKQEKMDFSNYTHFIPSVTKKTLL